MNTKDAIQEVENGTFKLTVKRKKISEVIKTARAWL